MRLKKLVLLLLAFVLSGTVSAQQAEPVPYELIKNRIEDVVAAGPSDFAACLAKLTPGEMELDVQLHDSLQIYADCKNVDINPILVNQAGYLPSGPQQFYYIGSGSSFEVIDSTGAKVGSGSFSGTATGSGGAAISMRASNNAQLETGGDTRYTISGSGPSGSMQIGQLPANLPQDQRLRIKVGSEISEDFVVSEKTYSMVKDAVLKFFGINRSGDSESWFHGPSHVEDDLLGGWYDCGDHLKEGITQSYAASVLGALAAVYKDRDTDHYGYNQGHTTNTDGIGDVLREAKHGVDYIIASYDMAGGTVGSMVTSVGNFGNDHSWWGSPEYQDGVPEDRGGPERELREETWSTVTGRFAAAAAFVGKLYEKKDAGYSAKAIEVAKALYAHAKAQQDYGSSTAYVGEQTFEDDVGLAAVALAWATGEKAYWEDLATNTALGSKKAEDGSPFLAGWLAAGSGQAYTHHKANTTWASMHPVTVWAMYKLILRDQNMWTTLGIDAATARKFAAASGITLGFNMDVVDGMGGGGSGSITIPVPKSQYAGLFTGSDGSINFDATWFGRGTEQDWIYNRYQMGNVAESFMYWDVARELESAGITPAEASQANQVSSSDWNSDQVYNLLVHQMDYMLGVNPWDYSMIFGVGDKNSAHPHHRAANPEGKNVPGAFYKFRFPHGGLVAGYSPGTDWEEHYDDWHYMEVCLDGATITMLPVMGLSGEEDLLAGPDVGVQIEYVGYDKAIVTVKQSIFGTAQLNFGTSATALSTVVTPKNNVAGVEHQFEVTGLDPAKAYYFSATAFNNESLAKTDRYLVDSTKTPYSFTTLSTPPAAAEIQNVKVCNVTSDSAEIMWYTPNGQYGSKVYWDEKLLSADQMANYIESDEPPSKFHLVKFGGLKEQTKYFYTVESDEQQRAVDEAGAPLSFTTPVEHVAFDIRAHTYGGADEFLSMVIVNQDIKAYDNIEARIYVRAPETVEAPAYFGGPNVTTNFEDHFMWRVDIGIKYNEAGFQDKHFKGEIDQIIQAARPVKMTEDTHMNIGGVDTYIYYIPIPFGDAEMASGARFRVDLKMVTRDQTGNMLDIVPKIYPKRLADGKYHTEEWSFGPKSIANGHPADFAGIPKGVKDDADNKFWMLPVANYMTIYRKDEFVWGYSPSYAESATKRANYEITMTLDSPFDVPSGTLLEIDQSSSHFTVSGDVSITEGGWITDIWVNGVQLEDIYGSGVVTRDVTTGNFEVEIPVKMKIGANDVDITVFAGPDPSCEECQQSGGCAFDNRNFFMNYSKGKFTESFISVFKEDGSPIESPVDIEAGNVKFHIKVNDMDKKGSGSVQAYVINPRKEDTLLVTLKELSEKGFFQTSSAIATVQKDAASTGDGEIAFFGADTIIVRYIDEEDEEDVSEASFFAKQTYPVPSLVEALDPECTGKTTALRITFSSAFDEGDRMDSVWVAIKDPFNELAGDSFFVEVTDPIAKKNIITVQLPDRSTIPKTTGPSGYIAAYIQPKGVEKSSSEKAPIKDAIAPFIIGFSLLENEEPKVPEDTMMIGFSEPVSFPTDQFIFTIEDKDGNPLDASVLTLLGDATTKNDGKSWMFAVSGNDGVIKQGNFAKVNPAIQVTDNGLNILDPEGCNGLVEIIEVPKPVPVKVAEMIDDDGDAYPDRLYMKFERRLRPKDMLDSFVVNWGIPQQIVAFKQERWIDSHEYETTKRTVAVDSTTTKEVTDSISILTIPIEEGDFDPLISTTGFQNGYGYVIPRLGPEGGFFDVDYGVSDVVGPRISEARLGGDEADSLGVIFSEPLDTLEDGLYYLQKNRGETNIQLDPYFALRLNDGEWMYKFKLTKGVPEENVKVGDLIRISTNAPKFEDRVGNAPGAKNPWVEIRGSLKNKIDLDVEMTHNVAKFSKKEVNEAYGGEKLKGKDVFRVTLQRPRTSKEMEVGRGQGDIQFNSAGSLTDSADWKHVGPTFEATIAMPLARVKRAGIYAWDYDVKYAVDVYDAMGQYVNRVGFKFSLDNTLREEYLDQDGNLLILIEWLMHDGTAPKAADGRKAGSGAFIGNHQLNVRAEYLIDEEPYEDEDTGELIVPEFKLGQVVKSNKEALIKFGFLRP